MRLRSAHNIPLSVKCQPRRPIALSRRSPIRSPTLSSQSEASNLLRLFSAFSLHQLRGFLQGTKKNWKRRASQWTPQFLMNEFFNSLRRVPSTKGFLFLSIHSLLFSIRIDFPPCAIVFLSIGASGPAVSRSNLFIPFCLLVARVPFQMFIDESLLDLIQYESIEYRSSAVLPAQETLNGQGSSSLFPLSLGFFCVPACFGLSPRRHTPSNAITFFIRGQTLRSTLNDWSLKRDVTCAATPTFATAISNLMMMNDLP